MANKKHQKHKTGGSKHQKNSEKKTHINPSPMQHNSSSLTPKESFTIKIEMLSDWHIGTGSGIQGDIDSLIKKDEGNLPYIPAKTVTGIWRDACELIAQGLDKRQGENQGNLWGNWVNYLFGDQPNITENYLKEHQPRHASLSVRAAYFPKQFQDIPRQLKEAITFVKPGIKIDNNSGCAEEDCLRFEEMVRSGSILEAECHLNLPENEDQKMACFALLIASTILIERLGGKRRRGAGKCLFTVQDETIKPWVEWLQKNSQAPDLPEFKLHQDLDKITEFSSDNDDSWVTVELKLNLLSPVIIPKRTLGNVVETLDYIPGTYLLRLIAKKLSKLGINLVKAIAGGDLLVTNGTLEINGQQSQPIPFALFYEKLGGGFKEGGKVYNRFLEEEADKQLKGYRSGFISNLIDNTNTTLPEYQTVDTIINTHNVVEDKYQRPTGDVGGVYSYQAIKKGTILRAQLRLKASLVNNLKAKNQNWWNEIKGKYHLGQSKKDDYGSVEIKVINQPNKLETKDHVIKDNLLYIWLLSDLLIRDHNLRPSVDINVLKEHLEKELGVTLELKLEQCLGRQNRLDSWQVRWGLPRPSLVGLSAGTCAVFEVKGTLDQAKLTAIEAKGIGERTAEGFGQICFNHPLLINKTSHLQASENKSPSSSSKTITMRENQSGFNYAQLLEKSALRQEIERKSLAIAANEENRKNILGIMIKEGESKPSMSQLGALRGVISKLKTADAEDSSKAQVLSWINSVNHPDSKRKDKWENGSLDKVKNLITNNGQVWTELNISLDNLTITQNGQTNLKKTMWAEAVKSLIDACIRAHKRDLEKIHQE